MAKLAPSSPKKYVFLSMSCSEFQEFDSIPSHQDAMAFWFLARFIRNSLNYDTVNPTYDEAVHWLSSKQREASTTSAEDASLFLFLSTHGFDINGHPVLCWKDSSPSKPNTMLTLSKLQSLFVDWFQGNPNRSATAILQTCRNKLDADIGSTDIGSNQDRWAVITAVSSGQFASALSIHEIRVRQQVEFQPAGDFSRHLFTLWKQLDHSTPINVFFDQLQANSSNNQTPEAWGKLDIHWPSLKEQRKPPESFHSHLFQPITESKHYFGREKLLISALGKMYAPELSMNGWLFSSTEPMLLFGISGSGKSSFLQAGLRSTLRNKMEYFDLTKHELSNEHKIQENTLLVCIDQVEPYLTSSQFPALISIAKSCKDKQVRVLFSIRQEAVGSWEELWQEYAPLDLKLERRTFFPLTVEEAREVIEETLPNHPKLSRPLLSKAEIHLLLEELGSRDQFGRISPALLQLSMSDIWSTKQHRPLVEVWRSIWNELIAKEGPKQAILQIVSILCPLNWKMTRKVITKTRLIEWLFYNKVELTNAQLGIQMMLNNHWLIQGKDLDGDDTYLFSHDLLSIEFSKFLDEIGPIKSQRTLALKLSNLLEQHPLKEVLEENLHTKELSQVRNNPGLWLFRAAFEKTDSHFYFNSTA